MMFDMRSEVECVDHNTSFKVDGLFSLDYIFRDYINIPTFVSGDVTRKRPVLKQNDRVGVSNVCSCFQFVPWVPARRLGLAAIPDNLPGYWT